MIPCAQALARFEEDIRDGIPMHSRCPHCRARLRFWIDVAEAAKKDERDEDGDLIIYGDLRCTRAGCDYIEPADL